MASISSYHSAFPSFKQKLATLDNTLSADEFARIKAEVTALVETERSFLPAHKKGGTVAYSTLREKAPALVEHYHSTTMSQLVSHIVGIAVAPTPSHDESSCSVLFYEKPGDHIGWHYDHNFYIGRHFTVLIPVVNCGKDGGLSAARLVAKLNGKDVEISTPLNRMIIFEGARVRHKVTPIAEGERRVVWSMTYCADPRNSAFQGIARRVKDTAFFGVRSLWS
jgi:2OG-Fe(II) oxygenase superfamily